MRLNKYDRAAIAAHQDTVDRCAAQLHPDDVGFEPTNFAAWVERCKKSTREDLLHLIQFVDNGLAGASGSQPYTDIRRHYSDFARIQFYARYPGSEIPKLPGSTVMAPEPDGLLEIPEEDDLPF